MPILENAKKALRASKRKAKYNQRVRSQAKRAIDNATANPTMETLTIAYSAIDKAVKRSIFHQNKANRLKSQLGKLVKPTKLSKQPKATKKTKSAKKTKPAKKKTKPAEKKTKSAKKKTKSTKKAKPKAKPKAKKAKPKAKKSASKAKSAKKSSKK
jgi:ribosomal protein S20